MKNKFKANIYEAEEWTLNGKKISCNIINDNMTKPPKWFQNWSETVYQSQPPQWFQHWSETIYQKQPPQWFIEWDKNNFQPLVTRIDNLVVKNNLKE